MEYVSLSQHLIPIGLDFFRISIENFIRGQQVQVTVQRDGVVPRNECRTKGPDFIQRCKAFKIRNPALEGREQAFDEGIVVADMGPLRVTRT